MSNIPNSEIIHSVETRCVDVDFKISSYPSIQEVNLGKTAIDSSETSISTLKSLKLNHPKSVVFSYININSIRHKLDDLVLIVGNLVDILCIAETKLDASFPEAQFKLKGFSKPYRLDKSDSSGGILTYIRSNLPSRPLNKFEIPESVQALAIEVNLRKEKWLLVPIYRPPSQNLSFFTYHVSLLLDYYASSFSNILIMGDFNDTVSSREISQLMSEHSLSSLVSNPTCFKSLPGRCIDLILTNKRGCFSKSGSFETGLSDFHHLIYAMAKKKISCLPPKKVSYRSYKSFSSESFRQDIQDALSLAQSGNLESFSSEFTKVVDRHAPIKTKILRGNNQPHVNQTLRKAIMKRSRLKNLANSTGKVDDLLAYKRQRNLVVNINRRAKRLFFKKVGKSSSRNSKSFWKVCKPLFSTKFTGPDERVFLSENGELVSDEQQVSDIFNDYFVNIAGTLQLGDLDLSTDISKYDNHPSILKILSLGFQDTFDFAHVYPWEVRAAILKINSNKATSGKIPIKMLKLAINECCSALTDCINNSILDLKFPSELKLADVLPVHKDKDPLSKGNYRPISILPSLSKIYEKIFSSRIAEFMENKLSKLLCGFRSHHSTQHALFRLIKHWQECLDKQGVIGTVLMDLSKAFDSLSHGLLLAKLKAYGFSNHSLALLESYLTERYQRTKVGSSFSAWMKVLLGVPQGSILGPLLFNIFINDMFLFVEESDVCNFADDNTLYSCGTKIAQILDPLKQDTKSLLMWFESNQLGANPDKFKLMFLGIPKSEQYELVIHNHVIKPSDYVKLLGITIDSKLKFDLHVSNLCSTANRKINCLYRIRHYLDVKQMRTLADAYILSSFKYAPLIWMFASCGAANKINRAHKRCLKAIYGGNSYVDISLDQLIQMDSSSTIHEMHLRILLTEVYKAIHGLSPKFMAEFFTSKDISYSLRNSSLLRLPPAKTIKYGVNAVHFRSCFTWNSLPPEIKASRTLASFKSKIKSIRIKCNCSLCRK